MIRHLCGSDLGVPRIPEALLVEWAEGNSRVVFSYAKQGEGISAHFAASKESLREVKTAIGDFCEWIFSAYDWCRCIFAVTSRKSIERMIARLGFLHLTTAEPYEIYVRYK